MSSKANDGNLLNRRKQGRPIIRRELFSGDGSLVGEIALMRPTLASSGEWRCKFYTHVADAKLFAGVALGGDALDAFLAAVEHIRRHLDGLTTAVQWAGGSPGVHGMPMTVPSFFGRDFEQRLQALVSSTVDSFARDLEERHTAKGTAAGDRRRPAKRKPKRQT
jgi:hypothetical protein